MWQKNVSKIKKKTVGVEVCESGYGMHSKNPTARIDLQFSQEFETHFD